MINELEILHERSRGIGRTHTLIEGIRKQVSISNQKDFVLVVATAMHKAQIMRDYSDIEVEKKMERASYLKKEFRRLMY